MQLYLVTDNVLTAVNYENSQMASAELGIHLVFGKMFRSEAGLP